MYAVIYRLFRINIIAVQLFQRQRMTMVLEWISSPIQCFIWDVITHPCPGFSSGLTTPHHYNDVIMSSTMASQITSLTIVYSSVSSGADQRKHQRSASLVFVWRIHRWPVNTPHKGPVTWQWFHSMTSPWLGLQLDEYLYFIVLHGFSFSPIP